MDHDSVTITRHLWETQRGYPQARGELTALLNQIALATKIVSREVNKAGLVEILGYTGQSNVQGEEVRKLDEFANQVIINIMNQSGHLCIMASEEIKDEIPVPEAHHLGKYSMVIDPLDGSSNIDANVSVGTIFGIYPKITKGKAGSKKDLLQPGRQLVAAGYVVYGSSTMLVISTGNGVHGFTLDPSVGEYLRSHKHIRIPKRGNIYSVNEGNLPYWELPFQNYIRYIKEKDEKTKRPYSARYIGSLVADFHRTLLYGGIFMYPRDFKDPKKTTGKLRLLYEANPIAFIAEQAGGLATDGYQHILDIQPQGLHQRVPFFVGSKDEVRLVEKFLQGKTRRS